MYLTRERIGFYGFTWRDVSAFRKQGNKLCFGLADTTYKPGRYCSGSSAQNEPVAGWLERLAIMAKSVVFAAAVIFALVLAAMILAVAFATQGAMAGNREIIEILHFVGAADSYISRQLQRHFFHLGLRGGAIGGGLAILAFFASGTVAAFFRVYESTSVPVRNFVVIGQLTRTVLHIPRMNHSLSAT
jgi:hypothetical protein